MLKSSPFLLAFKGEISERIMYVCNTLPVLVLRSLYVAIATIGLPSKRLGPLYMIPFFIVFVSFVVECLNTSRLCRQYKFYFNPAPLPCALRPFYINLAPCALLFFYRLALALGRYAKSPGPAGPGLDVKEGPKPLDLCVLLRFFFGYFVLDHVVKTIGGTYPAIF
jgi:hypothetical protein